MRRIVLAACAFGVCAAPLALRYGPVQAASVSRVLPLPAKGVAAAGPGVQTAVFSGGCFWGIQGLFEHVKGVTRAVSGYTGGTVADPSYEQVSSGTTGHAESVRVTFDPTQVSYGKLLQIFFSVALDPTEVNRQGPDSGTQYRSELFVSDSGQARVARAYLTQLTAMHAFNRPIATRVDPVGPFYRAEAYHQDYLVHHPGSPYIAMFDIPKIRDLEHDFPNHWRSAATTTDERS